jgi:SCY1-like protein 1
VPAFTRSLRDPFPHSRVAGLMALAGNFSFFFFKRIVFLEFSLLTIFDILFIATSEYYDATDCATKVLPCVSLVLIDKEKSVWKLHTW